VGKRHDIVFMACRLPPEAAKIGPQKAILLSKKPFFVSFEKSTLQICIAF
jgi:hypothetical protein